MADKLFFSAEASQIILSLSSSDNLFGVSPTLFRLSCLWWRKKDEITSKK